MGADKGTRILVTMTVGEYAGVPLQDAGDTWRNGAVFLLRKPAAADAVVPLDGWVTTVLGGTKAVITCGPSTATTAAESLAASLEAANKGLEYMSATGQTNSAIADVTDDNIVWWPEPTSGRVTVRATTMFTFGFDVNARGVVTDAAGNVVAPPPVAPLVHDAFRFIRICKTSDDLFDAYRNLFLAF
jgi:hypothetical protein